jgi:hypothetical protein
MKIVPVSDVQCLRFALFVVLVARISFIATLDVC